MSAWWVAKVVAGMALVVMVVLAYTIEGPRPAHAAAELVAQCLVLGGALVHLWHYVLLKRAVGNIADPAVLLVRGGLFGLVRHPMYLGDLLLYAGLALLAANIVAWGVFVGGAVAILRQSRLEDRSMRYRFPEPYARWAQHTKLIVPGVL